MENQNTKFYVAIALLVGLLGGYYYGGKSGYSIGYESARVEIKSRLEERRIIEPVSKEIRIISGVIQSLGDNQFVLESRLPFDPTLTEKEQNRVITKKVLVTPSTEISVRKVEANSERPKAGEPFRPFVVKNLKSKFKSLKVSEAVVVQAAENIADKSSFEASSIFKNEE